ncbi:MAG: glycosyltransferase, partial [Sphingobacteriales bacterium]
MEKKQRQVQIICLCPAIGFPFGQAATNRISLIGKAVVEGGGNFSVWHYGTSPNELNKEKNGNWNGINFSYLCGRVKRPSNKLQRLFVHFIGIAKLFYKLILLSTWKQRPIVYMDLQGNGLNIPITLLCKILSLKTVQEVNEWWPEVRGRSRIISFQYRHIMFRYSAGSFVISKEIEHRILTSTSYNKTHQLFFLPVLAEPVHFRRNDLQQSARGTYIFWCGMVDGYIKDVLFIIDAFSVLLKKDATIKLIIGGKYTARSEQTLIERLAHLSIPVENFILTGYISEEQLLEYIHMASVLVAPMWNDVRSSTRFPTKLGMFAFSGRPIVTSPVGELTEYFMDEENCLFYEASDSISLSK